MDSPQKQQAAERVKQANNILVTVSSNPSVDQLAACIGLTLAFNKMGKHATAVFSGSIPSTIEFLQPGKTLEKNTDSLRDFIIALDKSKADKLRYKVEDRVVKIFITPYKTSINEKDLEFSQGDFNVDVVLALGVHNQAELDQAITSHGRILHDATVITVNVKPGGELGGINWLDPNASSLSELGVQLVDVLDKKLIDGQIATALLTGIVAETDRFSNSKTSPQTMSISAELMGAGANQQLVATKLEEPAPAPPPPSAPIANQQPQTPPAPEGQKPAEKPADDGTLEIDHGDKPKPVPEAQQEKPKPEAEAPKPEPAPEEKLEPIAPQIHIDEHGAMRPLEPEEPMLPPKTEEPPSIVRHNEPPKMILEPPTLGGQLTASASPDSFGEPNDGLGLPQMEPPSLAAPSQPEFGSGATPAGSSANPSVDAGNEQPSGGAAPSDSFLVGNQPSDPTKPVSSEPAPNGLPPDLPGPGKTLSDIERDVHSSHLAGLPQPGGGGIQPSNPAPQAADDNVLPSVPVGADSGQGGPNPLFDYDAGLQGPAPQAAQAAADSSYQPPDVSSARDAVAQAINSSSESPLEPIQALNAQPFNNLPLGGADSQPAAEAPSTPAPQFGAPDLSQPFPQNNVTPPQQTSDPNAPPPVPPPMMPPTNPF
jgi:hypothetical protein